LPQISFQTNALAVKVMTVRCRFMTSPNIMFIGRFRSSITGDQLLKATPKERNTLQHC